MSHTLRVHLQDVVAHAEQQLPAPGLVADPRLELLELRSALTMLRRLLVARVRPAARLAQHDDGHEQQAQDRNASCQPLPCRITIVRASGLGMMRHRQAKAAVGVLLGRPAERLVPAHVCPLPANPQPSQPALSASLPEEPERGRPLRSTMRRGRAREPCRNSIQFDVQRHYPPRASESRRKMQRRRV